MRAYPALTTRLPATASLEDPLIRQFVCTRSSLYTDAAESKRTPFEPIPTQLVGVLNSATTPPGALSSGAPASTVA